MRPRIFAFFYFFFLLSCSQKQKADLLLYNATIYTVDSSFSVAEAIVIADGKIVAIGKLSDLEKKYDANQKVDTEGKFIYPGFIDAHAHFVAYGTALQTANFIGTNSWGDVIEKLEAFAKNHSQGWLTGHGWDQNDWAVKNFPTNEKLNELFPDRPVLLTRIDYHAAIANQKALDEAGIKPGFTMTGGEAEVKNSKLTGLLIDNAIDLVTAKIPTADKEQFKKALKDAEKDCFAMGITTVDDCGLTYDEAENIKALQDKGELKMRLYILLSDVKPNFDYLEKKGIIKTDRLHIRGFKLLADGALGSRGACLLQPYTDKPGYYGLLRSKRDHFDSAANWISQKGFQMCTHATGDSGTRTMLSIYAKYLKGKNDLRWRIEHAQVVNQNDFNLFGQYSIIPSVQPTHATSDMYWAGVRLGIERIKGAYAYKQLLRQNGWIPLGTDFPVEDISPIKTFYAAVVRKDIRGWPKDGFQMDNALTREEALRGMTIWAARANFEEKEKGSLEAGKWADFIILDQDIMKANENELSQIQVLKTYLGGERVFEKK